MPSSSRSRRLKVLAAAWVESLDRRVLMSASGKTKTSAEELLPTWMANQYVPTAVSFTKTGAYLTSRNTSKRTATNVGIDFLRSATIGAGVSAASIETPFITSSYTDAASDGGMTHTYLQQEFNGLPVLNTAASVSVDKQGRVLTASSRFVTSTTAERGVRGVALSAADALRAIAGDLGIALTHGVKLLKQSKATDRVSLLSAPDYQGATISANLSYVAQAGGEDGIGLAHDPRPARPFALVRPGHQREDRQDPLRERLRRARDVQRLRAPDPQPTGWRTNRSQ